MPGFPYGKAVNNHMNGCSDYNSISTSLYATGHCGGMSTEVEEWEERKCEMEQLLDEIGRFTQFHIIIHK